MAVFPRQKIVQQNHFPRVVRGRAGGASSYGFSLLEVLAIIAMMSAIVLPFTVLMTQTAINTKGAYIQSSRSMILSSRMSELSPEQYGYSTSADDASMNTSFTESGQTIGTLRKVDNTNSNIFQRMTYLYLYNNTTDALTAFRIQTNISQSNDAFRMRFGSTTSLVDNAGQFWSGEASYSNTTKQGGFLPTANFIASTAANIVNTSAYDDAIFQTCRYGGTPTSFAFDVNPTPAWYTVKLYFSENWSPSPTWRRMLFTLENKLMNNTAYVPVVTTGSVNKANIITYDVYVTDGTLNLDLTPSAPGTNPILNAIEIRKRTL